MPKGRRAKAAFVEVLEGRFYTLSQKA